MSHTLSREVICEIRWQLEGQPSSPLADNRMPSSLEELTGWMDAPVADRWHAAWMAKVRAHLQGQYPTSERLPGAMVPAALAQFVVRERFRHTAGWPVVQVGPGIVTWNTTEALDLDRAGQDLQSLWTAIREEYPADVPVQLVSVAFAVAEKHRLEGATLPEWLKARGLPDLAVAGRGPALGLKSPEHVAWEARFRDREAPQIEITLVLASRGSEEGAMDLDWRRMVAKTAVGDPATALAPFVHQAAQRLDELGLTEGNL